MFTMKQLAERWGVTFPTVRAFIESGKLNGHRVGLRLLRVPVEEVLSFEGRPAEAEAAKVEPGKSDVTTSRDDALRQLRATEALNTTTEMPLRL